MENTLSAIVGGSVLAVLERPVRPDIFLFLIRYPVYQQPPFKGQYTLDFFYLEVVFRWWVGVFLVLNKKQTPYMGSAILRTLPDAIWRTPRVSLWA